MSIQTICKSSCSEHWLEVKAPWYFRENGDSCPVCTESIIGDIVKTICGHSYHSECLISWHKSQVKADKEELSCPMCRNVLAFKEPGEMEDLEELEWSYWNAGAFELYGPEGKKIPCAEEFRVPEEFPLATDKPAGDYWW